MGLVTQRNPLSHTNCYQKKEPWILLIEDNQIISSLHKAMLQTIGCRVDAVYNAEDGLAVSHNNYDLIFLDIGLPGMSGIEAATHFRRCQNHKFTKLISLTAHCDENTKKECMYAGINQVLMKPIDIEQLSVIIKTTKQKTNLNFKS